MRGAILLPSREKEGVPAALDVVLGADLDENHGRALNIVKTQYQAEGMGALFCEDNDCSNTSNISATGMVNIPP